MTQSHFINGQWVDGTGNAFLSTNPATGAKIWEGVSAGEAEIESAVSAARGAFPAWSLLSLDARLAYLEKFQALLNEQKEELTHILCEETGKARWDASNEILGMIGKLSVSVAAYKERTGEKMADAKGFKTALRHKPHGVVAVYGPYNFPAHLPNGHILPALLAGNTVIFKPSEMTPWIAEAVVKLWEKTGIPQGVVNLVQGERETGRLLANAAIDGLFFTGSSATGEILQKQFSGRLDKILALELGGNNPLIVHEVNDIRAAVFNIIQSAFMSTGQRCSCARRLILVEDGSTAKLLEMLVSAAAKLTAGAYTQMPEPYMGPIISAQEVRKLLAAQRDLQALGGKILLEMKQPAEDGLFLTPGIIDVTEVRNLPDQEYFGPLLSVIRVKNFDDAIRVANATEFGLTSGLLSSKREHYEYFLQESRAGIVNWNRPTTGASATAPFGGSGKSGNHRPGGYYAADYCAYPTASSYAEKLELPDALPPGMSL